MRILANTRIRRLFIAIIAAGCVSALLHQLLFILCFHSASAAALVISFFSTAVTLLLFRYYFRRQDRQLAQAVSAIDSFLSGDMKARIESDEEGELFRLFHEVNTLSQVLSVRADKEKDEKIFLKDTISDISHQLKTPLAALSIYNGLLQEEAEGCPAARGFAELSEKELDRIEALVQSLLKITRLDAGALAFRMEKENVADLIRDIGLRFSYRAKQEGKEIVLSGEDGVLLECDRVWMTEAIENLVKNALDHTGQGGVVAISWKRYSSTVTVQVSDNGSGIHPEDLHHIFKRFYRSRYSKDTEGLGLGLSLAKAIVEGHRGTIEAESEVGKGSVFTMIFLV